MAKAYFEGKEVEIELFTESMLESKMAKVYFDGFKKRSKIRSGNSISIRCSSWSNMVKYEKSYKRI